MLAYKDSDGKWCDWWVGDGRVENMGRIVTFQADGHELEMIQRAMVAAFIAPNGRVEVNAQLAEPSWDGKEV